MIRSLSLLGSAAALVVVATSATAQARTDIAATTPVIGAIGGLFVQTGTVAVPVTPAVAAAVAGASTSVQTAASTGNLTSPVTGTTIPAAVGQAAIGLMTGATPEIRAQFRAAFSQSGASGAVVEQLMSNMPSLLSNPVPGQIQTAISAFNALINNANAGFLANPPVELEAVHAILLTIANAANGVPHP